MTSCLGIILGIFADPYDYHFDSQEILRLLEMSGATIPYILLIVVIIEIYMMRTSFLLTKHKYVFLLDLAKGMIQKFHHGL